MLESQSKTLQMRILTWFSTKLWVQKLSIGTVPRARQRWPK